MPEVISENVVMRRSMMALIGGVAGVTLWFLGDKLPDIFDDYRVMLGLMSFSAGFFAILLVSLGPLRLRAALGSAALVALIAAGLMTTASFRFDDTLIFLDSVTPFLAFFVLITIPIPFLIAAQSENQTWNSYPALFTHAWQIVVQVLVAWVFTSLFWLVFFISDQVLKVVGLNILSQMLQIDPVPFLLTGLALGLGLAVVYELRAYVSHYLVLRLLRLLLPIVLVVSTLFLLAAPIKGLSNLFGGMSSAGILMAMVAIAATLITATLDASEEQAAHSLILLRSAQAMALILPILGGLAAWAVGLRVAQYGWTPLRLTASLLALVVLGYGVFYAAAVLRGAKWRCNIRQANTTMALVVVVLAALWLSPVLNGERISTASQMARFESGRTTLEDLDLWAIGREWGRAGKVAITRLEAQDDPDLSQRLARLDQVSTRWHWELDEPGNTGLIAPNVIAETFAIRPVGAEFPQGFMADIRMQTWLDGCAYITPAGNPGCVALVGDFAPDTAGDEVLVVYLRPESEAHLESWNAVGGRLRIWDSGNTWSDPAQIDAVLNGILTIDPAPQHLLLIGEMAISIEEIGKN